MSFPNCLVFWQFNFDLQKHWQIIWNPSTKNDSWPDPSPNLHSSNDSCQNIHSCFSWSLIRSRWFFRRCFFVLYSSNIFEKTISEIVVIRTARIGTRKGYLVGNRSGHRRFHEHPSDNHDLHFAFPKGLFTTFFTFSTWTFYVTRTLINTNLFIHVTFCTPRTYSEYFDRDDETHESETLYPV